MNDQALPVAQLLPQSSALLPKNITEAIEFSKLLSHSDMVPKDFVGKPANILVAVQWGMELGLQPLQAMQNIAVINGRPSLWGDAVIALVRSSPLCEYVKETCTDTEATCTVKRRGDPDPQTRKFSVEDAKRAGLWGKAGTWTNYPKRMLQMRARAWCLRDVFPDVLRGMPIAEEILDAPIDVTPPAAVEQPRAKGEPKKASVTDAPAVQDAEIVDAPKAQADPAPAEEGEPAEEKPLSPGQIRILTAKLKQHALTPVDFEAKWGQPLTDEGGYPNFSFSRFQELADWIASKG